MNSVFGAFKLLQLLSEIVSTPAIALLKVLSQCADTEQGPTSIHLILPWFALIASRVAATVIPDGSTHLAAS